MIWPQIWQNVLQYNIHVTGYAAIQLFRCGILSHFSPLRITSTTMNTQLLYEERRKCYKMLVPDDIETLQSPKIGIGKAHLKDNSKKLFDVPTDELLTLGISCTRISVDLPTLESISSQKTH